MRLVLILCLLFPQGTAVTPKTTLTFNSTIFGSSGKVTPFFIQRNETVSGTNSTVIVTITGVGSNSMLLTQTQQIYTAGTFTSATVTDNHSNTYTQTTHTWLNFANSTGNGNTIEGLTYLLSAPSGSSTVTYTSSGITTAPFIAMSVTEIGCPVGKSMHFDKDAAATLPNNGLASSPYTALSITPSFLGEFLFGAWFTQQGNPGNAAGSPWKVAFAQGDEFIIQGSSLGATSTDWTDDTLPDSAAAIIGAFYCQ